MERALRGLAWPEGVAVAVDATAVGAMDTAGAWLLARTARGLERSGHTVTLRLRPEHEALLEIVTSSGAVGGPPRGRERARFLPTLGRRAWDSGRELGGLVAFFGEMGVTAARARAGPFRVRWRQMLQHVQAAGFEALPTAALLSFFIGVVIAFQASVLLRPFGAGILVADLVGLAMMRELSPLVMAIIVAGRSGSAYAAQIGAMKMTGEIDSLRAVGLSPIEVLVLPRIAALLLVLPLLTVVADVLGLAGAMVVARTELAMGAGEFLGRVAREIRASNYLLGVGKAPVFAVIVAAVGCYQGLQVTDDAGSVGRRTTGAVVQSMFLVVVADAFVLVVARQLGI
ncbi:MlaE family ABC transporter permease [Anaeromyxobacter oryzae]|uniref:MlaE family ABC transporter permease n=1 Tax=Anaeromyxobacter oryzae TaxID=2918170 RepID=UPI0020BD57E5|nr:ABC transporter permease [Anaeromyxobacter oryzae]